MIALSRSSEYALRALTYLASHREGGRYHLAREMAERLGMPAPFLGKILQPLVTRGLLESQRGRRGGFRLAVEPEALTLFDIVDAQEHLGGQRQCFLGQEECSDERACPLHEYWKLAYARFHEQLGQTTLADVLRFCEERPSSGYPARSEPDVNRSDR